MVQYKQGRSRGENKLERDHLYIFLFPFIIFAFLTISLLLIAWQLRSGVYIYSRLSSPLPTTACAFFLSREDFSHFFPGRFTSACIYPRYAPSAVDSFLYYFRKKKSSSRWDFLSRNQLWQRIGGYHRSTTAEAPSVSSAH